MQREKTSRLALLEQKAELRPIQANGLRKFCARHQHIDRSNEISNCNRMKIRGFSQFQDMPKQVQGIELFEILGGPGIRRQVGWLCCTTYPPTCWPTKTFLGEFQLKTTPKTTWSMTMDFRQRR